MSNSTRAWVLWHIVNRSYVCRSNFVKMDTTDLVRKEMNAMAAAERGVIVQPVDDTPIVEQVQEIIKEEVNVNNEGELPVTDTIVVLPTNRTERPAESHEEQPEENPVGSPEITEEDDRTIVVTDMQITEQDHKQ
jgi:hypothetical protein